MIEEILPAGAASQEVFGDAATPEGALFPEEEARVARAVASRRAEYVTARHCARRALAGLGFPPTAIVPGERGAPIWPEGVVGSITHCAGYRAAAVARTGDILSLGIDAEPDAPLPEGVLDSVTAGAEEREWATAGGIGPSRDRLLFSAKEAVYKAWFPLTGSWLGFRDAVLEADWESRTFTARLLVPGPELAGGPLRVFTGRWATGHGLLVTAVVVPAPAPVRPPAAGAEAVPAPVD
ncbi:4'-phosphopantetheinyl transferase superfamily protein [Streptomyces sp. N2-109]|uniref:4'-phosphopantetheinyl transferase superfamily protein n=1 Tax=Streptomyces gossypii TaxID=2883101 RepID=A0ABT2JVE1_9ACTN|nr:4'-phosphopantetheinyl transferase superfamily protein [Streptomyces gossypii]MCT2591633.1 4'-phosphopantetheinyl transferase superfamily protein [Streptomyces gossypii]